ncbi:Cutinase transcription factor 1 beta [Cyphellophora attinorum]|uniref:Cutinase transcription factor 1 beta n=1 Tax=Cyphellophora attinorum TaxID=1664694 RepID=A0A0N0NQW2_9EURO|nr:Cutinase transcription factor 1 beta [Phialophora attinorum]KPI44391.1 Cutinase transcription factor 1 beta [Phialophora attinorum]
MGFVGASGGACGGGLSEYVAVDANMVYRLPDTIHLEDAAVIEPLTVAHHSIKTSGADFANEKISVLISGGGPIGYAMALTLRAHGASMIILSEPTLKRRTYAEDIVDVIVDPLTENVGDKCRQATEGAGVDIVFDCAGSKRASDDAFDAIKIGGRFVNVAMWSSSVSIPYYPFFRKEVQFYSSCCKFTGLEKMITRRVGLEDIVRDGFEELIHNKDEHIKILISPKMKDYSKEIPTDDSTCRSPPQMHSEGLVNDATGLLVAPTDVSLFQSLQDGITHVSLSAAQLPPSPNSLRRGDAGADITEFPKNLYLAEDLVAKQSTQVSLTDEGSAHRRAEQLHMLTPPLSTPALSLPGMKDFKFLEAKGVWDLPCESVLVSSITGFIDYVYPLTPLLDLQKELNCIASNGESGKISLLLLYAVVLAGIPFMNHSLLSEAGYSSASVLSKTIYRRLRLLYDFDCEQDRLILVQCLLLMTYYHEDTDGLKHLRHWLGIAYRTAIDICLNREPSADSSDKGHHKLWKRLWWCCIIRDRACAIGMRQYSLISDDECLWKGLVISDFDIRGPSPGVSAMFRSSHFLLDTTIQHQLAELCIAQIALWEQLDQIMRLRYHHKSPLYGSTRETTLLLVPKPKTTDLAGLHQCGALLASWSERYWDRFIGEQTASLDNQPTILLIHTAMVRLLYHMLTSTLHRQHQQSVDSNQKEARGPDPFKARSSAAQMLSVFEHVQWRNLLHLLPGWSVTVLMQAALTFKDFSAENPDQVCRRLQDCIEILRGLRERHLHAAFGVNLLSSFLACRKRASNGPLPALRSADVSDSSCRDGQEDQSHGVDGILFTPAGKTGHRVSDDLSDLGLPDWDPPASWFTEFLDENL